MRESRTYGSVGALGGQPPRPTRPGTPVFYPYWLRPKAVLSKMIRETSLSFGADASEFEFHQQWNSVGGTRRARQFDG